MDSTSAMWTCLTICLRLTGDIKGLKIAVPKEYLGEGVSEESKQSVLEALKVLEALARHGKKYRFRTPNTRFATYYLLSSSEASANLARFDGIRYGYRTDNADNLIDLYKQDAFRRIRKRSQTPHHARYICTELRLLRRIL